MAKAKAKTKEVKKPTTKKKTDAAPVAHSGVAAELINIATAHGGFIAKEGEAFPDFAVRLTESLATVKDDEFNKISDAGRKWFDDAVEPINKKKLDDLPKLAGFVEGTAPAEEQQPTEVKPADDAKTTPETKPETKPATTKKSEKPPRGPRIGLVIAEMVAKKPNLKYDKLCEQLDVKTKKLAHDEGSYIYSRWEEAVHCMKVAAEK